MRPQDLAFVVGGLEVSVAQFARAIAVQDGCAEEFHKDQKARAIRMQEAKDILDRAFRYAHEEL